MMNWKKIIACGVLLGALLISSCDWDSESGSSGNSKYFTSDLRGTWVTSDQTERYTGTLVIDYSKITINFNDRYTYFNDNDRPFRNISTGFAQDGYVEWGEEKGNGTIFIKYLGKWQDGIPFFYESTGYPDHVSLLIFYFGGTRQLMVKQK